jgi:hypothetical protein
LALSTGETTTKTLEAAIEELRQDPERVITAEIGGLVIELHCKGRRTAGDVFREIGPWEGETQEELTGLLRQARAEGDSKEPPSF